MWYMYTMEYYSAFKKDDTIYCNMDGHRDYHTMWSMPEKVKYHISHMWNLKKWYKWTYLQADSQTENKLTAPKGKQGEKDKSVWD